MPKSTFYKKAQRKVAIAKATTIKDIKQDKIIKQLSKQLKHVETKYFDVNGAIDNVVRAPLVYNLSNLAQGSDITDRVGDKITPKWLHVEGYAKITTTAAAVNNNVRIVIVQDRYQNGTDPTFSGADNSIFQTPSAGVNETIIKPLKINLKQFKILFDRVVNLGHIATTATQSYALGPYVGHFKKRIKLHGTINYDASAGADASNKENNIYMLVLSSQNTAGAVEFVFTSRLAFTDM